MYFSTNRKYENAFPRLVRVAFWGLERFLGMFTSVMTEFNSGVLDVGFTKMRKKVSYDNCISAHAPFESRPYERSLIIFFFFPTFLEYASCKSESVSSFYYS